VRNPLAAAISACSFVSASIHETPPLVTKESQESVREDVSVIHSSLQYINDLLRNMLDIHRVSSHQMKVELSPTDLRKDVLDPVATLLYRRGDEFKVILECDAAIVVMTDRIRLKQIVLNLANNARKFVTK
jgi:signal transduction histidine kinase